MFRVNEEDNSIYLTRGDVASFYAAAKDQNGEDVTFQPGDVVRLNIHGKKDCSNVVLVKDFHVEAETKKVEIFLSGEETKIGDTISKPKDYWYDLCLNPDTAPQTFIGYGDDGPVLFQLYPEGEDREVG